jgi:peptide deformylase
VAEEHGEVKDEQLDPEREVKRRLALSQIRQYPDSVLRMQALEVTDFDADLQRLVDRMKALMVDARGVGLAGTQVGVLRRVFVAQLGEEEDELTAVVNPRLAELGEERYTDDEGCLSMQGVLVPVERHAALVLEGQDERGEPLRLELEGHAARIVQHETDHLDGVLILDRTTPEARREALATLRPQPILVVR